MLDSLTVDHFSPHLGQPFDALVDDGATPLELISATPAGRTDAARRQGFSLVFRGAKSPTMLQRMYKLVHPDMGEMDIFLVPIGPDESGMRYEAIFN